MIFYGSIYFIADLVSCEMLQQSCRTIAGRSYFILLHIKPDLQYNECCNKITIFFYFIAVFIYSRSGFICDKIK